MLRSVLLASLLAAEVLLCLALVDVPSVAVLVRWVVFSSTVQLVLVLSALVALAAVLFGSAALRTDLQHRLGQFGQAQRSPGLLLVHAIGFLAFLGLTILVLREDDPFEPFNYSFQWLAALWTLAALWVLAFWAANAVPHPVRQALVNNGLDVALAGLAVAVPAIALARLSRFLWEPMGGSTLWAVHQVLRLLYADVVYRPDQAEVGTSSWYVTIHHSCGGYEGIGLNFFFLVVYLWLFRRELRWPAVLLLFPLGAALMWLSNVVRIVALLAVGDGISIDVAMKGFHSQAGWILFSAVSLGMIAVSRRLRFFTEMPAAAQPAVPAPDAASPLDALPYLAPFLALLATIMLTQAFTGGFDLLYPLRFLVVAPILWCFRAEYRGWNWRLSWHALALGVAVFFLWIAMEPLASSSDAGLALSRDVEDLPQPWRIVWIVFRVAGSVITVPFAEELAFRGYLTRQLIATDKEEAPLGTFSWFSFVVSSVLFGLLHGRWLAGTLAGMAYALALYRRRSLPDAIYAHALTNALIAALVLAGGYWSLWT